jgi:hypothetical protein
MATALAEGVVCVEGNMAIDMAMTDCDDRQQLLAVGR